jgi:hypothetical protein
MISTMSTLPPYAMAWLRQRDSGAAAVAAIEAAELRQLDTAGALRLADALLSATPVTLIKPSRRETSGLVEQQRLFARARR